MWIKNHTDAHRVQAPRRGWQSVCVRVRIGFVTWETSLFPDTKRDSYLLPVKKAIRQALQLEEGSECLVMIECV